MEEIRNDSPHQDKGRQAKVKLTFEGGGSIMLGLIVLGWFIYAGIGRFADRDRSVVVKGSRKERWWQTRSSGLLHTGLPAMT